MPNKPLTRLLFAQGGLCFFCKEQLSETDASVEHLVAKANGGMDHDGNCVACCKYLNVLLGSRSLKEKIQVVLNQKGPFECPNHAQKTLKKTAPQALPKATKLVAERCVQVVENLKQRGTAKPRTVPRLKNMIATLFQNKLSQQEVDAVVRQLESSGVISINGSKLTYALPPNKRNRIQNVVLNSSN
jgi:hypothetical protein